MSGVRWFESWSFHRMIRGAVRRGRVAVPCRGFFTLHNAQVPQKHEIRRVMRHPPELVYKIVADVESYSEFLPYCLESTITAFDKATNSPSRAVLKVGWQQFEESFESKLQYTDSSVIAQAANTQMFNELYTKWTVTPLKGNHDKCVVDFALRFSFNNALYNTVSSSLGSTIASTMVKAFQKRAEDLANSN